MKQLHLIFARAANGVIGRDNQLPWHLPEDLAHFKRSTLGCPVIMGRKTWDSLPPRFRPLPGRLNIVITRQNDWQAEGAMTASTLQQAVALCPTDSHIWITGGADIFRLAMPFANSAVVTEIAADFAGDTYAPNFEAPWLEVRRESHVAANGLHYSFITYNNPSPGVFDV